ncbi:DUF2459 domain-containing protein [Pseudoduganella ginsengisoli]|uniref:DUF2459 domain-containing protein n=1 Tax=Pseudoduganella ginsengisoli TaxID=1462440 RepID=A0A6L6PUJ6_9BURK|nr:DUF2459 domain-containing protein [Pseudoduganella ginsengisoli]MTW00764.1 DUF2459 domain-containing protein [Pseudoduganella ginsengisoli]
MSVSTIAQRLAILAFIVLLPGCSNLQDRALAAAEPAPHHIYLIQNDWHTALLLDGDAIAARSVKLGRDFHGHRYLVVGWGDGQYFVEDSPGWKQAVKAMVASDFPALQVFGAADNPPTNVAQATSIVLAVTERGYQQLAAYIDRTIAADADGKPIYLGQPKANLNLYYQATGNYSLFNNCNSWVVGALQAAGLPFSGFNLTATSVIEQAQRISARQRAAAADFKNPPPSVTR